MKTLDLYVCVVPENLKGVYYKSTYYRPGDTAEFPSDDPPGKYWRILRKGVEGKAGTKSEADVQLEEIISKNKLAPAVCEAVWREVSAEGTVDKIIALENFLAGKAVEEEGAPKRSRRKPAEE